MAALGTIAGDIQAVGGDHPSGSDPKWKSPGRDLLPQGVPELNGLLYGKISHTGAQHVQKHRDKKQDGF